MAGSPDELVEMSVLGLLGEDGSGWRMQNPEGRRLLLYPLRVQSHAEQASLHRMGCDCKFSFEKGLTVGVKCFALAHFTHLAAEGRMEHRVEGLTPH